jgi:hypothetical protein
MDLFIFYPLYGVLVCKPCAYAVPPQYLQSHIATKHRSQLHNPEGLSATQFRPARLAAALAKQLQEKYTLLDPTSVKIPLPPQTNPPFQDLKLYNGYQCSQCSYVCRQTASASNMLQKHFNSHRTLPRQRGRPAKVIGGSARDQGPMYSKVHCQRFFTAGAQSSFFAVTALSQHRERVKPTNKADVIRALIHEELNTSSQRQNVRTQAYSDEATLTEVSPWLEMTRWPRFFNGLAIAEVAPLAYTANPVTEPLLVTIGESFDRIIEQAHQSVCQDRISVFDQAKINSFIPNQPSKHERLHMAKLQKTTFRAYKGLWKRLLYFAYRTSSPSQKIPLPHVSTNSQLSYLDHTASQAYKLLSLSRSEATENICESNKESITKALDRTCLLLCIALLDHSLKGDHFESVALSFLAVLGIDERPGGVFRGPLSYSPELSKFVKMAQMLVIQRAVMAAEEGEVEHPSDFLDEMRDRFMVRGSRSAFDWACRLRAYAKKIVDNTTSIGYISWSEDGQTATYKDTKIRVVAQHAQHSYDTFSLRESDDYRTTSRCSTTHGYVHIASGCNIA